MISLTLNWSLENPFLILWIQHAQSLKCKFTHIRKLNGKKWHFGMLVNFYGRETSDLTYSMNIMKWNLWFSHRKLHLYNKLTKKKKELRNEETNWQRKVHLLSKGSSAQQTSQVAPSRVLVSLIWEGTCWECCCWWSW